MRYLKLIAAIPLFFISGIGLAESKLPPLNTVKLQLNDEAWVKTANAKVLIAIDATLNQAQLANIHSQIMTNLQKIADKTDWHLTQFNRSKDQSNLERLQVLAEARLGEAELAQIGKRVETVNKPGMAYRIAAIEFNPSLADLEKARTGLRDKMYGQIKAELANLNKIYPEAHYFVHDISFRENIAPALNRSKMMLLAMNEASQADNQGMQVSNQLQLTADVILAADLVNK